MLFRIYASTREDELAPLGWDRSASEAFLRQQFDLQHGQYRLRYENSAFDLILLDGFVAGRLYVNRQDGEIRLMDIALLPEYRRRGIGRALMQQLIEESEASGLFLGLHVERHNPIRAFYRRIGFREKEDRGMHLYMVRPVSQKDDG